MTTLLMSSRGTSEFLASFKAVEIKLYSTLPRYMLFYVTHFVPLYSFLYSLHCSWSTADLALKSCYYLTIRLILQFMVLFIFFHTNCLWSLVIIFLKKTFQMTILNIIHCELCCSWNTHWLPSESITIWKVKICFLLARQLKIFNTYTT